MVRVCDAIMGTGKSSAAITYMNEHPNKKIIYVTPYLDEVKRIIKRCPQLELYEPVKTSEYAGSKTLHTIELVREGKSIATTHRAFRFYSPELLELIRDQEYELIIDENVNVLEEVGADPYDVQMAIDAGYIEQGGDGSCHLARNTYKGKTHHDLFRLLYTRDIEGVDEGDGLEKSYYYWQLPPELITAFSEVYILTYLFEGQSLCYFLKMNQIYYKKIGVSLEDKVFRFSEDSFYVPDYVRTLDSKIHLVEDKKLNAIGNGRTALSMNWFKKHKNECEYVKRNMYNFFRNITESTSETRMWSTYKCMKSALHGKGYTNGFVSFNEKATNKYKHKTALAYCVNLYMNVGHKLFYQKNGIEVDEDMYALSIMIQWIWRSAIRDGREIDLYIPSKRMRTLLKEWINNVSKGVTTINE